MVKPIGISVIGALAGYSAIAGDLCVFEDPIVDRIIVQLQDGVSLDEFVTVFEADHQAFGITLTALDEIASRDMHLLDVDPDDLNEDILDLIEDRFEAGEYADFIQFGEFVYLTETAEGKTGSLWFGVGNGMDLFPIQYPNDLLNLNQAHQQAAGAGVAIAVVDGGIDAAHPLLAGRVLANGFNFVTNSTNTDDVGDGFDTDGDGLIDENVGHGTYVAGLITLVAPDTNILPVVVLNGDGLADNWMVAKGLFYAIDQGVEVINASFGSTYDSLAVEAAVNEARSEYGIVVVGAAGNQDAECREYPAMFDSAFGIAATDADDHKADFSSYHDKITISAPGASEINGQKFSSERSIVSSVPGGAFAVWEGTSMSAPFVSGAIALLWTQHPEWDPANMNGLGIYAGIETAVVSTAVNIDMNNPEYAGLLGAGRLDVGAATMTAPPAPRLGDLDGDGSVSSSDLIALLGAWSLTHSRADLNGDGNVGSDDLIMLLGNWGG